MACMHVATADRDMMHAAALGEAVGLLVVAGATAAVWVCSTAVLLLFCAVIGTVWYILQTYVARRGEFGLHYFVGAADSGASMSSPATQVQHQCVCTSKESCTLPHC